jgi:hypothetical protein
MTSLAGFVKEKKKRHKAILDSNLTFYRHVNKRIFFLVSHFSSELISTSFITI